MQSPKARVTVVIASHNYGRYIGEAIESIVAQDYRPLRIAIVDDGSTDGTFDIVKLHMNGSIAYEPTYQKEPRVAWGDVKDIPILIKRYSDSWGPAFARNECIRATLADTDIYGILDADDTWKAGRVSRVVEKFAQHPENIGMVYTDYDTYHEDTGLTIREYKEPYSREKLIRSCICTNACFLSKKALETIGLYDEEMRTCEDWDLFVRLSERFLICHMAEATVRVRVHPKNTTNSIPKHVWERNWSRVVEKMQARARGQK